MLQRFEKNVLDNFRTSSLLTSIEKWHFQNVVKVSTIVFESYKGESSNNFTIHASII